MLESLDVLLFKRQDIVLILACLNIIKVLVNNGDKDVHENEERNELKTEPVDHRHNAIVFLAVVHDAVPTFTSACSP
jgi:hypothetical protein